MKTFLFLILTYIMGFLTAIPIGATQIEIAKRSLSSRLKQAYMVVAGSVCSDVMYGFIALFGLAPFLKEKLVEGIFELAAVVILWLLAFFTLKSNSKTNFIDMSNLTLTSKRLSFATGFSLAVTNPMMIFWWLLGAKFIKNLGLVSDFNFKESLMFLIVGGIGLASYLTTLANILHWAKKFISVQLMKKINFGMGIVLILLSFYFLVNSLHVLLH